MVRLIGNGADAMASGPGGLCRYIAGRARVRSRVARVEFCLHESALDNFLLCEEETGWTSLRGGAIPLATLLDALDGFRFSPVESVLPAIPCAKYVRLCL